MSELAWAAGFFDGEGCTTAHVVRRPQYNKVYRSLALEVVQKDRRPLDRFAQALGLGKIYGPYRSQREMHLWRARAADAEAALALLWPFLSEPKREQAERVKEALLVCA